MDALLIVFCIVSIICPIVSAVSLNTIAKSIEKMAGNSSKEESD